MTSHEILALAPSGLFLLGALLCLLFEAAGTPIGARKRGPRTHVALLALATCGAVFWQVVVTWDAGAEPRALLGGALAFDRLFLFGCAAVAVVVALAVAAAVSGLADRECDYGDAYALLLFAGAGLCALVGAREIITLAAASAFVTTPLVALASVDRRAPQGTEAAVKLAQYAALAFALLCFAAALRYGASGATEMCTRAGEGASSLDVAASVLLGVVLLGWIAAVPLHMVRVDVVHGAPPFVGGLVASSFTLAGAILVVRWLGCSPDDAPDAALALIAGCALLSLVIPPLAALDQSRVARVVAHLLCAQAGPILVAVIAQRGGAGVGPLLLAVAAVVAGGLGAVVAQAFLERAGAESSTWERYSGAGRRHPLFGLTLVWLFSSLAGLPGTAGFAARVVVGQSAFTAGEDLLGFAVIAAPALAAAPVLRLAIFLFAKAPDPHLVVAPSGWRGVVVAVACLVVLVLGVFPVPLLELAAAIRL